jgi:hypothetical protein
MQQLNKQRAAAIGHRSSNDDGFIGVYWRVVTFLRSEMQHPALTCLLPS